MSRIQVISHWMILYLVNIASKGKNTPGQLYRFPQYILITHHITLCFNFSVYLTLLICFVTVGLTASLFVLTVIGWFPDLYSTSKYICQVYKLIHLVQTNYWKVHLDKILLSCDCRLILYWPTWWHWSWQDLWCSQHLYQQSMPAIWS